MRTAYVNKAVASVAPIVGVTTVAPIAVTVRRRVTLREAKAGRTSEEEIYYERDTWHALDVAVTVGCCSEGRNNINICQSLLKDQQVANQCKFTCRSTKLTWAPSWSSKCTHRRQSYARAL